LFWRLSFRLLVGGNGLLHVELIVWNDEPLDWLAADDVRVDDLVNIRGCDVPVPDSFWINDDRGPKLALIQASCLVRTDHILDSPLRQLRFEKAMELALARRIAATARMAFRALIRADENVLFEFRHGFIVTASPFACFARRAIRDTLFHRARAIPET
jgi:hypothetical protein